MVYSMLAKGVKHNLQTSIHNVHSSSTQLVLNTINTHSLTILYHRLSSIVKDEWNDITSGGYI